MPADDALISLLDLNSLGVPGATCSDIEHLGLERGHRALVITRKGRKVVTVPPLRRCLLASTDHPGREEISTACGVPELGHQP
jgi:hypothetical protein